MQQSSPAIEPKVETIQEELWSCDRGGIGGKSQVVHCNVIHGWTFVYWGGALSKVIRNQMLIVVLFQSVNCSSSGGQDV